MNSCLEIDTDNTTYYSFSSSEDISLSMYYLDPNSSTYTLDRSGKFSSMSKAGIIQKGPAALLFSFKTTTKFSIGLASFGNFNCSRVYIDNSQNSSYDFNYQNQQFFSLPITETPCFFYSADGQHSINSSLGKCRFCPTIDIYAGLKQKIASLISGDTRNDMNPMINTPTFIIMNPAKSHLSDLETFHFSLSTNKAPYGFTSKFEYIGLNNSNSTINIKKIYIGNAIVIAVIIICFLLIVLMLIYYFCKQTLWCHKKSQQISFDENTQFSALPIFSQSNDNPYYSFH